MTAKPERPFPFDTATGIKDGAIVYFGWQTLVRDPESGDTVCIVGKTKSAVVRTLVKYALFDFDNINLDQIVPIAMTPTGAITTKSAGRFNPVDYETTELVEKNVKAAKTSAKKNTPPIPVDEDDDLI